uniref:Histone-lysine N-methyltransferase H3 lysine-9 specific SUVH4-like n=1 Tax=Rhizophora mucronata TaxID=61149 RepID=A0A2P2JUY1_RHIMU
MKANNNHFSPGIKLMSDIKTWKFPNSFLRVQYCIGLDHPGNGLQIRTLCLCLSFIFSYIPFL